MFKHISRGRAVAVAAAVAAAGLGTGAVFTGASAATAPRFLSVSELPQGERFGDWKAGPVRSGVPKPQYTCIKGLLPAEDTKFRKYHGEFTAEVRETVTVLDDVASAKLVAKEVMQGIERCADDQDYPTTWKRYASYDVEEGLTVYGVFFAPPNSEYGMQLYGVGRDGRKVVVTTLGMMGRANEAPVKKFTATAKTALRKAF
jgi:hypothetical protein